MSEEKEKSEAAPDIENVEAQIQAFVDGEIPLSVILDPIRRDLDSAASSVRSINLGLKAINKTLQAVDVALS